jgi:hypothetical protein
MRLIRKEPTSTSVMNLLYRRRRRPCVRPAPLAVVLALFLAAFLSGAGLGEARADSHADGTATPYAAGDRLTGFTLENQHDETGRVDASTKVILFSRDMDGGKLIKEALEDVPQEELDGRGAVYVSDISGMPGFVAKMFAVPSMRKRPYALALDRDGEVTARIPDVEEKATLVFLQKLTVERIVHASTPVEVRAELGLADSRE